MEGIFFVPTWGLMDCPEDGSDDVERDLKKNEITSITRDDVNALPSEVDSMVLPAFREIVELPIGKLN